MLRPYGDQISEADTFDATDGDREPIDVCRELNEEDTAAALSDACRRVAARIEEQREDDDA